MKLFFLLLLPNTSQFLLIAVPDYPISIPDSLHTSTHTPSEIHLPYDDSTDNFYNDYNASPLTTSVIPPLFLPTRHSTRTSKLPSYLHDYVHPYQSHYHSGICSQSITSLCVLFVIFPTQSVYCIVNSSLSLPPAKPSSYEIAYHYPEWQQAIG